MFKKYSSCGFVHWLSSTIVPAVAVYRAGHNRSHPTTVTPYGRLLNENIRVSISAGLLEYTAPYSLTRLLKNVMADTYAWSLKCRYPRISFTVFRYPSNAVRVTVGPRLMMYRSPTITVQPLIAYNAALLASVIGNDSHNVPQLLHCDVHSAPTSYSVHVCCGHCNHA